MSKIGGCPRCDGPLYSSSDYAGSYTFCLVCGYVKDIMRERKVWVIANGTNERYAMAQCPGCGEQRVLDKDQYKGKTSTHCADIEVDGKVVVKGCEYHETIDWRLVS